MRFCENIQGYNLRLTKEFAMNINGLEVKFGTLTFLVTKVTVKATTKIPIEGEKWFKGMPLEISYYRDFLKPEYRDKEYGSIMPKEYLLESYSKFL